MFKKIKSYFTLKYRLHCFRDFVSGNSVDLYIDCYGDMYMKDGRWSIFSVKVKEKEVKYCQADRDGGCSHDNCPQLRDNEPEKSGRGCTLPDFDRD